MDYKQKTKELKKAIKELRFINPLKKQIDPKELCDRLLTLWRKRIDKKKKNF